MIDPALEEQLQRLLAEARPGSVPGNVLVWWGPSDFPDGQHLVPTLSQAAWEARYLRLTSGAVAPDALPRLSQLELGVRRARPDGALPIAVVDVEVAVSEPTLVSAVVAAAKAGTKLAAPPRSLAAATTTTRVFFAAGLLHQQWGRAEPAYRGFDVSYVVDPQLFVTDRGRPSHLDVDAGDGRGFRTVRFGEPFAASYPPKAKPVVTVRVEDGRRAAFTVTLSDVPAAPAPDEVWDLTAAGDKPNTGCAYVHRAPGHADVTGPVIVAEGFPGAYAPDYLYDLVDQHGLLKRLLAAGRDVLLLSFENGADRIEKNAGVVTACIREARRRTAEPLAVGGVSMGGLVARYALTEMEHRGEDHQTALFFTVDTPHRGAYTSVGAQWFAHAFQRSSSFLAGYAALLDAPANQQFVQRWVHDGAAIESPLRRDLLRDLAGLGDYPRRPRRIAVSCGRGDGARSIPPATPTMSWSGSPFVDAQLTTMPEHERATIGRGYWFADAGVAGSDLTVDGDWSWEGAPGGQDTYAGVVARAAAGVECGTVEHHFDSSCSLPTVSALGLDQGPFVPIPPSDSGGSPFDAYTYSDDNQPHLVLEPRVADWLAKELTAAGAARAQPRARRAERSA
ncbi:MAG TPA: hypothetical protein VGU73_10950 [Acidimicrobiia bacterium]|nr:hypothetical protein [Acidimicrobiia bacterium]